MRPTRQNRSRRDGERGAATTEALIILPFFFIVWGALFFSHRLSEKKVVVNEIARTCAWAQMTGGCTEPQSPRCNFSNSTQQLSDDDLEGSRASLINYNTRLESFELFFNDMFGPYFRATFGADREATVPKPRQIGGGEFNVGTEFSEMCNEVPGDETVPTVSEDSFCTITGWC